MSGKRRENETDLTPREVEILTMLAKGYSNAEIGAAIGMSQFTVADHVKRIYVKVNVNSRAEAGVRACEMGLHCTPAAAQDPLPEALLCTLLVMCGHEPGTHISQDVLHLFSNRLAAQVRSARG